MKLVDHLAAKQDANAALLAGGITATLLAVSFWQVQFRIGPIPPGKAAIPPEITPLLAVATVVLMTCSLGMRIFRRRIQITSRGVQHYPFLAYRGNDYLWEEISNLAWRTFTEQDESNRDCLAKRFIVELKNGKEIEEPSFCTEALQEALEIYALPEAAIHAMRAKESRPSP